MLGVVFFSLVQIMSAHKLSTLSINMSPLHSSLTKVQPHTELTLSNTYRLAPYLVLFPF
jgi:hypothetical protein